MHTHFQPFPVLATSRLKLRQITLADDNEIFFQRSDAQTNKYIDRPPARSIEEAREWIERINRGIAANESIFWGLTFKETDVLIGGLCLWNLSRENNTADIGFSINPEHWGKGLMQEALAEGIRFGFETMELDTIEAYTHPDNIASIKRLERNNFRFRKAEDIKPGSYSIFTCSNPKA